VIVRSVNVSLSKQVQHKNKTISTGIFKQPVSGRVAVNQFNLAGDQQVDLVNHGGEHKAVYGFASDHYAFWEQKLNLAELNYGKFGENLTIDGLAEDSLCIGDQLQVGESILEITQPRVPCFKLGLTFSREDMPRLFVENAATGIYFRVVHTGSVAAGDSVSVTLAHPDKISVKQLFRAYFDKNMSENEAMTVMEKALTIDALSIEWREKLEGRLNQS
jgi:MOSC domain-containing protein YiiM